MAGKKSFDRSIMQIVTVLITLVGGDMASATDGTWNTTNTPSDWSINGNWLGGNIADGNAAIADFSLFNISSATTVNIDGSVASRTIGIFKIGDLAATPFGYSIAGTGGGTLSFQNAGSAASLTQSATSSDNTFSVPIVLLDDLNVTNAATATGSLLTISGGITGNKNLVFNANTSAGITVSTTAINIAGSITNSGAGAGITSISGGLGINVTGMTQSSNSSTLSVSGPVSIGVTNFALVSTGGGLLQISGGISAGTGGTKTIIHTGAGSGSLTLSGIVDGSGVVAINQNSLSSSLTISGVNTFTGGITLNAGTLLLDSTTALSATASTLTINGGELAAVGVAFANANSNAQSWNGNFSISGAFALNLGAGAVSLGGNRIVTSTSTALTTVGGAVTGTASLELKANAAGAFTFSALVNNVGTITNSGTAAGGLSLSGGLGTNVTGFTQASSTSNVTIGGGVSLGGDFAIVSSGSSASLSTLVISGPWSAGNGGTKTITHSGAGTGSVNMTSAITDGSGVVAIRQNTASSILNLANINSTFSGGVTIDAGVVTVSLGGVTQDASGSLGKGATNVNANGELRVVGSGSAVLDSASSIFVNGGTLRGYRDAVSADLLGDITVTANSTVISDRQSVNPGVAYTWGTLHIGAFQLNVTSSNTLTQTDGTRRGDTIFNNTILTGNATFNVTSATGGAQSPSRLNLGGINSTSFSITQSGGSYSITKIGNGQLALFGSTSSNYGGGVILTGGTLLLGSPSALGTGTLIINSGTSIGGIVTVATSTNNNAQNWNGDFTIVGPSSLNIGTGAVTLNGNRIITGNASGNATFTVGGTVTSTGSANLTINLLSKADALPFATTAGPFNGSITFSGLVNHTGSITNSGTGSGLASFSGGLGVNVSSVLQNSSTSFMVLSGASPNFAGGVTVQTGTLRAGNAGGNALNVNNVVAVNAGATFDTNNFDDTIAGLNDVSGGGTVTNSGAAVHTLTLGGSGTYTFSGVITAATPVRLALTKSGGGTQTLNNTNTYAGPTTIQGGTLVLGASGSIAASAKIIVGDTLANGAAIFDVSAVSGGFAITSGQTLAGHGTVNGNVSVTAGGIVAPGNSNGILTVAGNFKPLTGTLAIELSKTAPASLVAGTDYDQVKVTGVARNVDVTNGILELTLGNFLQNGEVYFIVNNLDDSSTETGQFTSGSINGVLATVTPTSISTPTFSFAINYAANISTTSANDISLTAVSGVPEPVGLAEVAMVMAALLARRRIRPDQT